MRAGGIAILGFLVGLGLSTVIGVVLSWRATSRPTRRCCSAASSDSGWGSADRACVAVRLKGTGSLRDLGLVRPRGVDVALGAGFAVAGVIIVSIAAVVIQAIDKNLLPGGRTDVTDPIDRGRLLGIVVVYLIAVVGAPFFEELYFRGLVQGTLTARWGVVVGIVVQALLFGLVHLGVDTGWGNVGTFIIITIVGIRSGNDPVLHQTTPTRDVHPRGLQRDHRHDRGARRGRTPQAGGRRRARHEPGT